MIRGNQHRSIFRDQLVSVEIRVNCFRWDRAPIVWNVDAIEQAIARGQIPRVRFPFSILPKMTAAEAANIDWPKVESMLRTWREVPAADRRSHVISQPSIQVLVRHEGFTYRVFVDGNHRTTARQKLGKSWFESWVVDADYEPIYRLEEES